MVAPQETTTAAPTEPLDPKTLETAEVLEAAADYIEIHGWTRRSLNVFNRVCTVGAIYKVTGTQAHRMPPDKANRAYKAMNNFLGQDVVNWNDGDAESGKQVVRTLRTAAAQLLHR